MRVNHAVFAKALEEARGMTEGELRATTNAGTSSSYYVRDGERLLPLKAVLRPAYMRAGQTWDGPQSKAAFAFLRDRFPVEYRPTTKTLNEDARREQEWVERIARPGQSEFRRALIARDGVCALTGFSVLRTLEAAHVVPVKTNGSDAVGNGILLRADIHRLFDAHLLAMDPADGSVWLHSSCQEDYEELLNTRYDPANGVPLEAFAERWSMRFTE